MLVDIGVTAVLLQGYMRTRRDIRDIQECAVIYKGYIGLRGSGCDRGLQVSFKGVICRVS